MKISAAILSTALLAAPALARGRGGGKNGKSGKGKSAAVEEEEETCECIAPSVVIVDGTATTPPITTVEEAVAAAPPNCVVTVPTAEMLIAYPPPGDVLVPVVPTLSTLTTCTMSMECASDWSFLDGTEVPATVGVGPMFQWTDALPVPGGFPVATVAALPAAVTDPVQFINNVDTTAAGATVYYSCCIVSEETCAAFELPATAAPTPAPTKGKNGKNGKSRRLV